MKNTRHEAQGTRHRIGIMGGTFDPIHFGHLMTAEQAFYQFSLNKVIFIPTGESPHKRRSPVTGKERYKMAVIATADNDHFKVSRIEIDRPGISYTVDTLRELKNSYPNTEFFFISGADAILEILTWKDADKIAEMAKFIAATRPGYHLDKLGDVVNKLDFRVTVSFLQVPALAISSTDIRIRVLQNKPIRYLLPENVCSYIYKKGFYR